MEVLDGPDGQCFRAEATVKSGTWLLLAGAIGLALVNHFVSKAAKQQMEDDHWVENYQRHLPQSVKQDVEPELSYDFDFPPPGFTDYYRWLLSGKDDDVNASVEDIETVAVEQIPVPVHDLSGKRGGVSDAVEDIEDIERFGEVDEGVSYRNSRSLASEHDFSYSNHSSRSTSKRSLASQDKATEILNGMRKVIESGKHKEGAKPSSPSGYSP